MKLQFLGQYYSKTNNQVKTLPSEYQARFLGQSYTMRRPVPPAKSQLGIRKKYRGVAYDLVD